MARTYASACFAIAAHGAVDSSGGCFVAEAGRVSDFSSVEYNAGGRGNCPCSRRAVWKTGTVIFIANLTRAMSKGRHRV